MIRMNASGWLMALIAGLGLQACSSTEGSDITDSWFGSETVEEASDAPAQAEAEDEIQEAGLSDEIAAALFPSAPTPSLDLTDVLVDVRADARAYHFDALRIPAGSWDGYVQASNGAFLQCLVAWGPPEARLGISTGWEHQLFIQFRAPDWPLEDLVGLQDLVVRVDGLAERAVPLEGSGDMLWGNMGDDLVLAQALADGDELTLSAGNYVMVYPLTDSHVAIPALYECSGLQTDEGGDGGLSVVGLEAAEGGQSRLTEAVVRTLLEGGFGDIVLRDPAETMRRYGIRALFSAPAWGGEAELFAGFFGFVSDEKKALIEIANDAARLCRGEVAARLIRIEPSPGTGQFGKASILCADEGNEFVLETLAFFDGRSVLAIHALVDDVGSRERIDESYDRIISRIEG